MELGLLLVGSGHGVALESARRGSKAESERERDEVGDANISPKGRCDQRKPVWSAVGSASVSAGDERDTRRMQGSSNALG